LATLKNIGQTFSASHTSAFSNLTEKKTGIFASNSIRMKKFSTLLISILFVCIGAIAQKNYTLAYIVKNNNDTINGFIDYREWYKNPESILFTQSKEATAQKLNIQDISSFNIIGKEQYRRYIVNISMAKDMVGNIDIKDTSQITDTVFLKVLNEGKNVQLLSYTDNIKSRLYIFSSEETAPIELKNTEYISEGQLIGEKEYRSVLLEFAKKYVPENIELKTKIFAIGYYKSDILDICYEINGISKDEVKKASKEKQPRTPYRIWAGVGLNNGEIKIEDDNRYTGKTSGTNITPLLAAGMDIFLNPNVGRMFLRTQLSYTTYKMDGYTYKEYFASKESYYLKFKQTNIAVHEELNYNLYNGQNFKYFIGAGVGFNFSSYPLNEETFIRGTSTDTITNIHDNYIAYIKKFWLSAIIKTGISVKRMEVSIGYAPKSAISNYTSFAVSNSSFRLQLAYLFKK
jgi:hypothetical protein